MKRLILLLMLLPLMAHAQYPVPYLPDLHVEGNTLKDAQGNKVVLHGVMDTPSMWFNSNRWTGGYNSTGATNCVNYFKKIFNLLTDHEHGAYCNVFRLHMDPAWTNQSGTDFRAGFTFKDGKTYDPHGREVGGEADIHNFSKSAFKTYLKSVYVKIALEALKKGMYVVVRPCGVCPGYIEVGDYYNDYLTYIWDEFSKNDSILKYSGQISIELANEPVTLRAAGGASDKKALHDFFQPIVNKIRSNGFDGIIWAPGVGWQAGYEDYAAYPIEGANIGYAVHNYTGWYGGSDDAYDRQSNKQTYINNYINQFKKQVPVVETNPIIITEVDWSPYRPGSGHYNEHGDWVESNYGTWATGSTSKWGVGYKALLDHFGNISMTLSATGCYLDIDKSLKLGYAYPAFKDDMEKDGKDPYDGSGVACFDWYEQYYKVDYPHAPYKHQWTADNGAGKFVNPILNGDFPDPDVIRVGDVYYMVSTTFTVFPGATIMKSYDLVNWEYCANPLLQIANDDNYNLLNGKNHYAQGQWAASLNYHDGKFYLYFISYGKDQSDGRNIMLTTTNPEGTWDMQYWPEHYYDSGWLFDDGENGDGNVYVACGIGDIWVNKLDGKTLKKISSQKVISARDGLEGSHMYHIGDFYYLYLTTGGYWRGQTIYRSKNPMGPYEECPNGNQQAGSVFSGQGIHQGALVETQTGEWWTIMFKDAGAIGRVPYLEPVKWVDGWPIIGSNGTDVSKMTSSTGYTPKYYQKPNVGANHSRTYLPTNDTFTELTLGKQWGWNHNPDNNAWSLLEQPGSIRLHTTGIADRLDCARNSLTQRILGYNCEGFKSTAKETKSYGTIKLNTANMLDGDVAGLSVFQDPYSYIGVKVVDGQRKLVYYRSEYDQTQAIETLGDDVTEDVIFLRAIVSFVSETVDYYYSYDNVTYTKFGSQMKPRFTLKYFFGQRFFLFNYATKKNGGYVDIDWFSTEPEFSEEMFYGPGVLNTFTAEDATAKELSLNTQTFNVMPGSSTPLNITCTMESGMKSNVTTACSYTVENSDVAYVYAGRVVGKGNGTTNVTATYTDPLGGQVSISFSVNVSFFPVGKDSFNPSITGAGSYEYKANLQYGIFKTTTKNGIGGWIYDNGANMKGQGRYFVVKLYSGSLSKPKIVFYDNLDFANGNHYESEVQSGKLFVIDLEEVAKQVDLSHIYCVGFSLGTTSSAFNIREAFFSEDGETPSVTPVENVEMAQDAQLLRVEFFTMDGRKHQGLQKGTNIVRRVYSDGHVESVKILK